MWNSLEHHIWSKLKSYELDQKETYLLAISGGVDSMGLLNLMKSLKPQARLVVMHVHHGDSDNKAYRDQSYDLVKSYCEQFGCVFEFIKADCELKNEEEMRMFRLSFFDQIKEKYQTSFYLTAHHQDDVLETWLIKMIRGSGAESLARFSEWNGQIFRPFYSVAKKEVISYVAGKKVTWLDDPTNEVNDNIRNWLRNSWLPELDKFSAGAVQSFSRSIQNLISESSDQREQFLAEINQHIFRMKTHEVVTVTIDKNWFMSLPQPDQMKVLLHSVKQHLDVICTQGQIKEILKRLDKNQNEHTFSASGMNWLILPSQIVVRL